MAETTVRGTSLSRIPGGLTWKRLAALLDPLHYVAGPLLFLLAWELATRTGVLNDRFYSSPTEIVRTLVKLVSTGKTGPAALVQFTFMEHLLGTLSRMMRGFLIAVVLGVPLGMIIGWWNPADTYLRSLFELLRPIPGVTLLPLTLLWFGVGDGSQIPVIVFAAFFPIFINSIGGVHNVNPLYVKVARVLELNNFDLFRKVIFPAALPHIATGLRLSVVYALTSGVGTEVLAGSQGLGFLIVDYQRSFRMPAMYASMVIIAVIGFALNTLLVRVVDSALRYRAVP
jgi:NitT/TauT family transport system permease protein